MIEIENIRFQYDRHLDLIIVRTDKEILTKISLEALLSADAELYKLLFEGIILIIRGELPAGDAIKIHKRDNGDLELVK